MRARKPITLAISALFLLVLSHQPALAQSKLQQELHQGWKFHEAGKQIWYPAAVPGCVHVDLMNNNVIGDPFYRDNEQKLQWIGKTTEELRLFSLCQPGLASGGNQDRGRAPEKDNAAQHGIALLADQRLLAGGFVVQYRLLRALERQCLPTAISSMR